MTLAPAETFFPTDARGAARGKFLASFRYGLRALTNPDTKLPFTDAEIALATNEKSDAYRRADALDIVLFSMQQRGLYLSQQWDPRRANTSMLQNVHGYLWDLQYLAESGGSGTIVAKCNPLTTFVGSTTFGDPTALKLTDPGQKTYQVLFTKQAGISDTEVELSVAALDGGAATNLVAGTKLTWTNPPLGALGQPVVLTDFAGGGAKETDRQFAERILRRIRHKPGAGNRAQFRQWAEESSRNAVQSAFVYSCAFNAGSVLVAVVQRRGAVAGPTGGTPSVGTLATVTEYLVVVPEHVHVVVTGWTPVATDMVLEVSMPVGIDAGWADLQPWPKTTLGAPATITGLNIGADPLTFRLDANGVLPTSATQPQIMLWDDTRSRWEKLFVASTFHVGGGIYHVTLSQLPAKTLALDDVVSPYTARAEALALAIEAFFDSLGPGQIVDVTPLSADPRRPRAARFPPPNEEYPMEAGTDILTFIKDAFGTGITSLVLSSNTNPTPGLPTDPVNGPERIVAGKISVYAR